MHDGVLLSEPTRDATLKHVRRLWGYDVSLAGVDAGSGNLLYETSATES